MKIRADLHTHTNRSFDGRQSIEQLTAAAKKQGLQAVAVTEHGLYRSLPEQMDGVLLIPGCEFYTDVGHMTGLFLEREPNIKKMTASEAIDEIHRCGGIAVLAHPFQKPGRTSQDLDCVPDAVETANARADYKVKTANAQAMAFALARQLPAVGGSDAHSAAEVGNAYTEIDCEELTLSAIRQAVLRGHCSGVLKKTTPQRMIGLSQLKRRRTMGGIKNLMIGLAYLGWCIIKDCKEWFYVTFNKNHRHCKKDEASL